MLDRISSLFVAEAYANPRLHHSAWDRPDLYRFKERYQDYHSTNREPHRGGCNAGNVPPRIWNPNYDLGAALKRLVNFFADTPALLNQNNFRD